MQLARSRIWIRVAVSISYDDNHYTTGTSLYILTFLDVLVECRLFAFVTSIYRKPTFTSLHLSWDAFAPKSRKVNQIKCLTFEALEICSDNKIKSEFEQIKNISLNNTYPKEVIVDTINKTVKKFRDNMTTSKCPVYVRLPLIGSPSLLIAKKNLNMSTGKKIIHNNSNPSQGGALSL